MKLRRAQTAARAALGQYDAVMRDAGGRNQGPPTAKLYVSNLDPGVTPRDIKELFELVGPLTKHELNFQAPARENCPGQAGKERRPGSCGEISRVPGARIGQDRTEAPQAHPLTQANSAPLSPEAGAVFSPIASAANCSLPWRRQQSAEVWRGTDRGAY